MLLASWVVTCSPANVLECCVWANVPRESHVCCNPHVVANDVLQLVPAAAAAAAAVVVASAAAVDGDVVAAPAPRHPAPAASQ